MSRKTLISLWIVTGIAALLLAVVTVKLAADTRSLAILGRTAYLTGKGSAIELRLEPDPASPVVAALVRGSSVEIVDTATRGGMVWVQVQKGRMTPGWLPRQYINLDPP